MEYVSHFTEVGSAKSWTYIIYIEEKYRDNIIRFFKIIGSTTTQGLP